MYKCPVCNDKLELKDNSYVCSNKHSFDLSKFKYINLNLNNKKNTGDSDELVIARNNFLNASFYLPLRNKLIELVKQYNPDNILDLACGTGYYTNKLSENANIYGVDLSKKAITIASKAKNDNVNYLVSSIFNLPFYDNYFDLITLIFAPSPIDEIKRCLKNNGYFIEVTPAGNHLYELKQAIYDSVTLNDEKIITDKNLKLIEKICFGFDMTLSSDDIFNLFAMTPYYYKSPINTVDKLKKISSLSVRANFVIAVYQLI